MTLIREYRPEDERQVEECFIELQEFERRIEPRRIEGKIVAKNISSICLRSVLKHKGRYSS
jgi:hypothetical protein